MKITITPKTLLILLTTLTLTTPKILRSKKHHRHHHPRHAEEDPLTEEREKIERGSQDLVEAGSCNGTAYKTMTKPDLAPLDINFKIPIKYADPGMNKPVFIIPQIIVPKKKRRIIVHHNHRMMDYYRQMAMSMNPFYMKMFKENPYYDYFKDKSEWYKHYWRKNNANKIKLRYQEPEGSAEEEEENTIL